MTRASWYRLLFVFLLLFFPNQSNGQAQGTQGAKLYLPLVARPDPTVWMGPYGGSIVALAAAPGQPQIVYAGTAQAGVFRSDDSGVSWKSAGSGLENGLIDSLAVHPKNSQVVYAGTHGSGVYRTRDGGASWQAINHGIEPNSVVYTMAVNPGNPNLIYAGTRIKGTYYHGILYKSVDAGDSWEIVLEFTDDWVYSIAVNPGTPNVVVAAVHAQGPFVSQDYGSAGSWQTPVPPAALDSFSQGRWLKGRAVTFDPRPGSARVYYGAWHDGFLSFSPTNGELLNGESSWIMANGAEKAHVYPNGISINPSAPVIAYFAGYINGSTVYGDLPGGVWRSDNAGTSWYATGLKGKYTYSVAALSGDTVLAGTYSEGLYRSTNGGATWNLSVNGLANSLVTGMVFTSGSTIYASTTTGGGVWKSTDGGVTWNVFNSGLGDTWINGLVQHPGNPNVLFALTRKAGLRRIDLASGIWTQAAVAPLTGGSNGMLTLSPGSAKMQAFTGLDLLNDGEKTASAPQMILLNAISQPVLCLRFAPSNSNIAYLGTEGGGMYQSADGGATWQLSGLTGVTVRDIAVDPLVPGTLYAAVERSSVSIVQKSTDGGAHWADLPVIGGAVTAINAIGIDSGEPNAVFVGTNNGIYRYGGLAWTFVGLDGLVVNALARSPHDPGRLYAATDQGVFDRSTPQSDWVLLYPEIQGVSAQSLNFDPVSGRHLNIGTTYRGVLRVQTSP